MARDRNPTKPSLETLFWECSALSSPLKRAELLERRCASDSQLRAKVERMLAAEADADRFAENLFPMIDLGEKADAHGQMIGPYKLLERIAEGGMGVVYVAEQALPIRRRVAIKIIKPGMDSRQVIARFEAERQALALMDHPNIARVLDAGATETGHPYFVMELVCGVAITEFCEREQLSIPERLRLVASVCRAVQHAHQKGIIHRDLKPSNVLVTLHDGVPVAKVIDFGVAKALHQPLTEKTLYTGFGHMVGTPMYMSPEQAEMSGLDVDTRSDVYSLGVLLYELLTGVPPFDPDTLKQGGLAKLQQVLRETEPCKPSARISTLKNDQRETLSDRRQLDRRRLEQVLRGDLDWVVMKALEKDRNRRYSAPAELADDLERYLKRLPVLAGPPSWRYKAQKFVRRHRVLLAVGSLILLVMAAGTAFSTWYALEADAARDRANQSEKLANERLALLQSEQQNLKAEQQKSGRRFELARQAVARLMDNVATYRLLGNPELMEFRNSLLITADDFYSQLIRENAADVELYLARAGVREQLRRSQEVQADLEEAVRLKPDSARVHIRLAELYRNTADPKLRDPPRALKHAQRAVELDPSDKRNWFTLGWVYRQYFPQRSDDAAQAFLKASELEQDVLGRAAHRAMALQIQGRHREAIAAYTEGIDSVPRGHYHLYAMRAACHTALGELDAALADVTKSIELNAFAADAYRQRAAIRMRREEYAEAAEDWKKALSLPPEQDADRGNLLRCYLKTQQWGPAAELLTQMALRPDASRSQLTLESDQSITSSGDPALLAARDRLLDRIAEALRNTDQRRELVEYYRGLRRYDDAIRVCDEVISSAGDRAPAEMLFLRGEIRRVNLGQIASAREDFEHAIRLQPDFAEAHLSLARAFVALDLPSEAVPVFQRAISLRKAPPAALWFELGALADGAADYALAAEAFEQMLKLKPDSAKHLNAIAWMLATRRDETARDLPRAIELARRAIEISPEQANPSAWNTLGVALYYAGQYDEAIAALNKSEALASQAELPPYNTLFLAMAYSRLGQQDRSRLLLEQVDEWLADHAPANARLIRFHDEARALIESGAAGAKPTAPLQRTRE